jgi:hypothetical protein
MQNIQFGNEIERIEYERRMGKLGKNENLCPGCGRAKLKIEAICLICRPPKKTALPEGLVEEMWLSGERTIKGGN